MHTQTLKISAEQREQALLAAGFAGHDEAVCELKFGGQKLTAEVRDELLKKCANNEYVELELNVIAYEQREGLSNRNFVRVKESALGKLASSSVGKPFLRDHQQNDSMAVCGTITHASVEKLDDGTHRVMQTVKLTAPWAVDLALRGLMKTVSISWRATDKVDCSVCNKQVLTECYHWPGEPVKEAIVDGKKYFIRDRSSSLRVEWVYNSVEALETSPVPVPAVPTARIDGIRASLSAGSADENDDLPPDTKQSENKTMNELETLKAQLTRAHQIAELNDGQKAYFRRLGSSEQDAFLAKSAADRNELCKVIYTAKNGQAFTAADDPRMVQMAKDMDAQKESFDQALKLEKAKGLAARASTELAHLSGTVEQRAALLGAIDSIEDVEVRNAILASIKDFDSKQSKNFTRSGAGGGKKPTSVTGAESIDEKLTALAEKIRDDSDEELSFEQAYDKALASKEGQALYAQMPGATEQQN